MLWLVFRNFSSLAAAEIACRAISLVAVGFYARQLQPENFGYLGFSLAVVTYAGLFVMQGYDQVGMREIARRPEEASRLIGQVLGLRLSCSVLVYAVFAAAIWQASMPALLKRVMLVDGLTLFPLALSSSWALQGLQRMHLVAIARVVQSLLLAALIFALVRGPQGVVFVAFSNLLSGCAAAGLMLALLARSGASISISVDRQFAAKLARSSLPFALMMACIHIYSQSGLVLLGWWRPGAELGWFAAAHRLIFGVLQQFSIFLLMAFMPALSHAYAHAPEQLARFHVGYQRVSWVCAGGIVFVFGFFAEPVLRLCFGDSYVPAAGALRLMACAMAAAFLSGPYVAALAATRFERELMWQTAGSAALCMALNWILIPSHGMEGAAAALLVSISSGAFASAFFYRHRLAVLARAAA